MPTSILTLNEFTKTFYKQIGLFEHLNQTNGTLDPLLNKIIITDDSTWMDRESKLTNDDGILGVFIPYNRYEALVPYMEQTDNKTIVYVDIAFDCSHLQNSSLYTLTQYMRDLGPFSFTTTNATYNIETTPATPNPSGDVPYFSRVPGPLGDTVNILVSGTGAGTDTLISVSGTTVICTYDETAITAEEISDIINASPTAGFTRASFSGDGSGIFNPTGVSGTVTNIAVAGTAGTIVGSKVHAKIFSPNTSLTDVEGIEWSATVAGPTGNSYAILFEDRGAGTAESVSGTGYAVTVILGTDGSGVVTSTNASIIALATAAVSADVAAVQVGGVGLMSYVKDYQLVNGQNRPSSITYKALYVYKTTNDDAPSYVIVGVEQARQLGLIDYLEDSV